MLYLRVSNRPTSLIYHPKSLGLMGHMGQNMKTNC
jgi:hypothetical protein